MSNGNINLFSIRFTILVSQPFQLFDIYSSISHVFLAVSELFWTRSTKTGHAWTRVGILLGILLTWFHVFIRKYKLKFWFSNTRGCEYNSAPFSSSEIVIPIRPLFTKVKGTKNFSRGWSSNATIKNFSVGDQISRPFSRYQTMTQRVWIKAWKLWTSLEQTRVLGYFANDTLNDEDFLKTYLK